MVTLPGRDPSATPPPTALQKVVGNRTYEDLLPVLREALKAPQWATDSDRAAIKLQETLLSGDRAQRYAKELTFTLPASPSTPLLSTVYFNEDRFGGLVRSEWHYTTQTNNLIRVNSTEWELEIQRQADGDHYTLRMKHGFVGALRMNDRGTSHIFYSHLESVPQQKRNSDAPPPTPTPAPGSTTAVPAKVPPAAVDEQRVREEQLTVREKELAAKEQQLKELEARLTARSAELATLQSSLQQTGTQQTKERERLDAVAADLTAKHQAQQRRQEQQDQREKELAVLQQGLKQQETQLVEAKRQLDALTTTLQRKESDLAADRVALGLAEKRAAALSTQLEDQRKTIDRDRKQLDALSAQLTGELKSSGERTKALESTEGQLVERAGALDTRDKALTERAKELVEARRKLDADTTADVAQRKASDEKLKAAEKELLSLRESLARDRAALDAAKGDLTKQQAALKDEKTRLEALAAQLAARTGDLDTREASLNTLRAELTKKSTELGQRADELAKREAAERAKPKDLSLEPVTLAPAPALPKFPEVPAAKGPNPAEGTGLVIPPAVPLPRWASLASGLSFDRGALERRSQDVGLIIYAAGGDSERARKLEDSAVSKQTSDFHNRMIDSAYRPLIAAHYEIHNGLTITSEIHERLGRDAKRWTKDDIEIANKALQKMLSDYAAARNGLAAPKPGSEEQVEDYLLAGAAGKAKALRAEIARLQKLAPQPGSVEEWQLRFLENRALRMEELAGWLDSLEPHMKRVRAAVEANRPWEALLDEAAAPAPSPTIDTSTLRFEKLTAGLTSGSGQKSFLSFTKAILDAPAENPDAVRAALGQQGVEPLKSRLAVVRTYLADPKFLEHLTSEAKAAVRKEVEPIITSSKAADEKRAGIQLIFEKHLGRPLTLTEQGALTRDILTFQTLATPALRTAFLNRVLEPVSAAVDTNASATQKTLLENLDQANNQLTRALAALAAQDIKDRSDLLYRTFAGAVPGYGSPASTKAYYDLQPGSEQRKAFDKALEQLEERALDALNTEIRQLEREKPVPDSNSGRRLAVLMLRRGNIESSRPQVADK